MPATSAEDTPESATLRAGYEQFFRENRTKLRDYGRRIGDSPAQGEDAVQEALIEAYRRWADLAIMDSPLGWVLKVAQNKLYRLRRDQRRASAPTAEAVVDSCAAIADDAALWEAVRQLPPRRREVVCVRYIFDLEVREIAQLLDLRESTVRSHLTRAHAQLRQLLAEPGDP